MKTTEFEMNEEALLRMRLLQIPEMHIQFFVEGKIPVTLFSAEVSNDLELIHQRALDIFIHSECGVGLPFYITESWHGTDIVSILFVSENKEEWISEREQAKELNRHKVYAYCICDEKYSEVGMAEFSIENSVLWRVL